LAVAPPAGVVAQTGVSFAAEKVGEWVTVDDSIRVLRRVLVFEKFNINQGNFCHSRREPSFRAAPSGRD
jgi:hypothetical protein